MATTMSNSTPQDAPGRSWMFLPKPTNRTIPEPRHLNHGEQASGSTPQ